MKTENPSDPLAAASGSNEPESGADDRSRLVAYRNILVPIDFSEHSEKTIEYGTQLAAMVGACIKILHVLRIPEYPAAFYQGLYIEHEQVKSYVESGKREASAKLSLVTEQILSKGLKADPVLRVGNPFEEIVSAAKEMRVDLIVIGSHGSGGLGRFLLGSTAERVVQYASCPVLVVKDLSGHE